MRGILYKDLCLLFRTLDKKSLLVFGALGIFFAAAGGVYTGMVVSAGLSICTGMMHLQAFENERKTDWEKYQRILPLRGGTVVAGKYAAILLTVLLGMAGALGFSLLFFAAYGRFEPLELGLSALMAALFPMVWTALVLPAYYWFGPQAAQPISMLPLLALCAFFHRIGDGGTGWAPALLSMVEKLPGRWLLALPALAGLFLASLALSAAGYRRRN